jgi:hypothetical protein
MKTRHTITARSFQAIFLSLGIMVLSSHSVRADFSGYYDPANFTLTNTSADGFIDTSSAPGAISLVGGSNGSGDPGTTDFTILAPANGVVSFDWSYASLDLPLLDDAGFLLNGVYTELAAADGLSGPFSIPVVAGDVFGFRVETVDNTEAPGIFTVSNFSGPTAAVPEASTLALIATGATSLLVIARRRKKD